MTRDIEELSAELHEVYMKEAARQGDVRHAEDYNELPDRIKEFDRALARHIIAREKAILSEIEKPLKEWQQKHLGGRFNNYYRCVENVIDEALETINRLRK